MNFMLLDIRVGYEETHFTTPEGNVLVMLCAIIYEPSSGVTPRSFNLSYMTEDYTAGRYCVYTLQKSMSLYINHCHSGRV